jgi:HSP20 family molecular chaperone IbpA
VKGMIVRRWDQQRVWVWADRLLVVGIVVLTLYLFIRAVSDRRGAPHGRGVGYEESDTAVPKPIRDRERMGRPRTVAIPTASEWVAYGGLASERGDRRRAWSEEGVMLHEWRMAPAAPGINVEEADVGYRVTCRLPGWALDDLDLDLTGGVLSICSGVGTGKTSHVRLRLPDGGEKRISESVFSNGLLQISIIQF